MKIPYAAQNIVGRASARNAREPADRSRVGSLVALLVSVMSPRATPCPCTPCTSPSPLPRRARRRAAPRAALLRARRGRVDGEVHGVHGHGVARGLMTETRSATSEPTRERSAGSRAFRALALPTMFWAAYGIFIAGQTYLMMLSHGHSIVRLVVYNIIVSLYWAAAFPLIAALTRRFPLIPWRWRSAGAHLFAGGVLGLAHMVWH